MMTRPTLILLARQLGVALTLAVWLPLVSAQSAPAPGPVAASAADGPAEAAVAARLVALVNEARRQARDCGTQRFEATAALRTHTQLEAAARVHARDLAERDLFSLTGSDGSSTAARVEREGYRWSGVGENLTEGETAAESIVQRWLSDPMQCSNIMHPAFTDVGVARGTPAGGVQARVVWSMVVGRPRTRTP